MRYIFLALLLLSLSSYSQTISKQVIGPGGQTFENGNNKLSYTVGEVAVGAMTDEEGTYQLGNGYYPSLNLSTLNTETPELQLLVKVFPNPTKEVIYITHPTEQLFEVRITDVSGKQIHPLCFLQQSIHSSWRDANVLLSVWWSGLDS